MEHEELRDLRISRQLPAREMVAVVQALYPKYDKTIQSKCENGDTYGVTIRPDAMRALYAQFAPERLEPPKRTRHGQHRLTRRISCRLENEDYEALQQLIAASGCETVQEWLTGIVRELIRKGVIPDAD